VFFYSDGNVRLLRKPVGTQQLLASLTFLNVFSVVLGYSRSVDM